MSFSDELYNTFIKNWNENADEYMIKNNMKFLDVKIRIVDYFNTEPPRVVDYFNTKVKIRERPFVGDNMKMFYTVFNGSVCDLDHWNFFQECLNYTYQKNSFTDKFNKKYISFREYWDKHIDDFNKQFELKLAGNDQVIVIDGKNNNTFWYKLRPITLKCFYNAFNGPVCDIDHWNYFKECTDSILSTVEDGVGMFYYIGEKEIEDKTPSFEEQLRRKKQHHK